jgi:hypothetical protein
MQALKAAAVLHDVGKLAVPEYIISKPNTLHLTNIFYDILFQSAASPGGHSWTKREWNQPLCGHLRTTPAAGFCSWSSSAGRSIITTAFLRQCMMRC